MTTSTALSGLGEKVTAYHSRCFFCPHVPLSNVLESAEGASRVWRQRSSSAPAFRSCSVIQSPRAVASEISTTERKVATSLSYQETMLKNYVPIFVMLPLGFVTVDNVSEDRDKLVKDLKEL
ncbi:hypothetical protein ACFX13_024656 [Malus domestica]